MEDLIYSRPIRLFLKYCECGSLKEAANSFDLSISSASRMLAQLEDDLGFDLFDRTHRPMKLTQSGRQLAGEIAPDCEHVSSVLKNLRGQNSIKPEIRIGIVNGMSYSVAPIFIDKMRGMAGKISVFTGSSDRLVKLLQRQELDLVISSAKALEIPNLARYFVLREPAFVILPHPVSERLSENWTWPNLSLCGLPFISSNPNSGNQRATQNFFNSLGVSFKTQFVVDNLGLKLQLISRECGWSIVHLLGFLGHTDIISKVAVRQMPGQQLTREIYLLTHSNFDRVYLSLIFNLLLEVLREDILPQLYEFFPFVKERVLTADKMIEY